VIRFFWTTTVMICCELAVECSFSTSGNLTPLIASQARCPPRTCACSTQQSHSDIRFRACELCYLGLPPVCQHPRCCKRRQCALAEPPFKMPLASLYGHGARVFDVNFAPTSDRIVSASEDQSARVWSFGGEGRGAQEACLMGHSAEVMRASWHPSEDRIATGTDNQRLISIVVLRQL
jgi:WD40 repeat protein